VIKIGWKREAEGLRFFWIGLGLIRINTYSFDFFVGAKNSRIGAIKKKIRSERV